MQPTRADRLQQLFHDALALAPSARSAFLDVACADDLPLRREVADLLAADGNTGADGLLRQPLLGLTNDLFQEPDLVGREVGPYRLVRELGQGGMGTVYLAERPDVGLTAAVKVMRGVLAGAGAVRRFALERRLLARLEHPHIARLFDAGTTSDGVPYLVMEYVEGEPLTDYCLRQGLSVRQRVSLFLAVCDAVEHAHHNLIVHRDLKPSNILVTEDGTVKLLDFGIAKLLEAEAPEADLTRTGMQVMTPEYAAPEQVRGEPVTTATDVYALGIILYELLTGRRPYDVRGRSLSEVARIICEQQPARPSTAVSRSPASLAAGAGERLWRDLSGDLDTIVLKALRKEPADRYASAERLADDLRRYLEGRPVQARPQTAAYRLRKFVQRHRPAVVTAVMALLLALVFFVREGQLRAEAERARDQARLEARKSEQVAAFLVGLFDVSDPYSAEAVRADTVTARTLLRRGAERITEELASQPDVQAELLDAVGRVYTNMGLLVEARPLLTLALSRRTAPGTPPADFAESLNTLGELLFDEGDYPAAESLFRRSLDVRRSLYGDEHAEVAVSMNNLALSLYHGGRDSVAEPLYREALALERRLLGPSHHEVAVTLNNLGALLRDREAYTEGEAMLREALAIWRGRLGDEHPQVALCLNNLGSLLRRKGDLAGAETAYREVLAIRRKKLGNAHPHVATSINNLAVVLSDRGDYEGAEALHREALALRRQTLGDDHPRVALSLYNIGTLLRDRGRLDEAAPFLRDALALWRRRLGDDHPDVADGHVALAQLYLRRHDGTAAEPHLRQALAILQPRLGSQHSRIIRLRTTLDSLSTHP